MISTRIYAVAAQNDAWRRGKKGFSSSYRKKGWGILSARGTYHSNTDVFSTSLFNLSKIAAHNPQVHKGEHIPYNVANSASVWTSTVTGTVVPGSWLKISSIICGVHEWRKVVSVIVDFWISCANVQILPASSHDKKSTLTHNSYHSALTQLS